MMDASFTGTCGSSASLVPDLATLTTGLSSIFRELESGAPVTVLERAPNLSSGRRSASEVVTILTRNGDRRRLFCKYGGHDWPSHGLWGVSYEVEVYRKVLAAIDATTARFYGAYTPADSDRGTWLVIEYLDGCEQLKSARQPNAMIATARWLARFHAASEGLLLRERPRFLKEHDTEYYQEWTKRTLQFAASQPCNFPWLPSLCQQWEELARTLLVPATSIIHGDFYSSNTLIRDDVPFVVDWESAAVGVGEIDLAFHVEGWPEDVMQQCVSEYRNARWPEDPPPEFSGRLQAARLFQQFRWLGDRREWTSVQGFEQLRALALLLGLL